MTTKINSKAELKKAAATLHDARFTADAIGFDDSTNVFTLKCWVFESEQNRGRSPRRWKACRLSFKDVADYNAVTREKVCYYELSTMRFSEAEHRLDLVTHYGIRITLKIGELDGELTETGETRELWN